MTRGALIFGIGQDAFDYVAMARWSARRIMRHLGIPVTLVTDQDVEYEEFDHTIRIDASQAQLRWFDDVQNNVAWNNDSRPSAYDLSPYDQTLLLDADYVVASDALNRVFESRHDILCYRYAYDAAGIHDYRDLNWFGKHRMPMSWATVVYFQKSRTASDVFDIMKMIKQNWRHYRDLFAVDKSLYRNDYAISIALSLVHGHMPTYPGILGAMASVDPRHRVTQIEPDRFRIDYVSTENQARWTVLDGVDFHAMGKKCLGEIVANNA